MTYPLQHAVTLALLATLAGLWFRDRLRECVTFVAYAAAIIVCGNLVAWWPAFRTPEFWAVKQAVYDCAKLLLAVDLAERTLAAFPGARAVARRWMLLALVAGAAFAMAPRDYVDMAHWQPRLLLGVTWLFGVSAAMALHFRLPLRLWHRALLAGFSAYLMVFAVLLQILQLHGWTWAAVLGRLDGAAYLALCCGWAVAAWWPETVPDVSPEVLRRIGMREA